MSISTLCAAVVAALAAVTASTAIAHITYAGRELGSFDGLSAAASTLSNQAVSGNFGWADATDADFGDSHKARACALSVTLVAEPQSALLLGGRLLLLRAPRKRRQARR